MKGRPEAEDPLEGNEFQRSPHLTASASATWRPLDALSLSLRYYGRSGYFDDDLNTPARRLDGTHVIDARAAWEMGRLTLFAFATNLFDRFYLNSMTDQRLATAGNPRQVGLGVEAGF